jgi:hypothetical protein
MKEDESIKSLESEGSIEGDNNSQYVLFDEKSKYDFNLKIKEEDVPKYEWVKTNKVCHHCERAEIDIFKNTNDKVKSFPMFLNTFDGNIRNFNFCVCPNCGVGIWMEEKDKKSI